MTQSIQKSIQTTIQTEMVAALKSGDRRRKDALSFLLAGLKDAAKDKQVEELTDADAISALQKQHKKVQETREATKDGNRPEVHDQAVYETALIAQFLPEAPSAERVTEVARTVIGDLGATSVRDMGRVMAEASAHLPGVDKSVLSGVVKGLLSS
jgi:hypothetical protein